MSQLFTQMQNLQNKVDSLSDTREFYVPETASSSGATHVSSRPSTVPSASEMRSRASGLPHDALSTMGTSGKTFSERLPAREKLPSALFGNSKNLASSYRGLRPEITENTMVPEREMRREPQNWSIPGPRCPKWRWNTE